VVRHPRQETHLTAAAAAIMGVAAVVGAAVVVGAVAAG